jgi:hypothetical protein
MKLLFHEKPKDVAPNIERGDASGEHARVWRRVRHETTTNRRFERLDTIWETVQMTTHSWAPKKIKQLCLVN